MNGRTERQTVSFELERRQLTTEQAAAGKRLFARLIERAEAEIQKDKRGKDV